LLVSALTYFPFFAVVVVFADPLGTLVNRRFTDPQGGQDQLSGSLAQAAGP
jgi:hypothetical protein